jgi:hypothetical protein
VKIQRRSGVLSNRPPTDRHQGAKPEKIMPERSIAQTIHAAMVLLGWAGLIVAGVCFPAMVIVAHFYNAGGETALYWLGPAGLFVGCLSSVVSIFFAHATIGLPLPSGSARLERWIVPFWIALVVLLMLRWTVLSGTPAVLAEILYSTYPFLIALGLAPALTTISPDAHQTAPQAIVTQQTRHSGQTRRSAGART